MTGPPAAAPWEAAFARLGAVPRLRLGHLPTPCEPMPRLGAALGLRSLWVKRDDCTGVGLGGNKIRKLEFALADALVQGAGCVVCSGVAQSNTLRQLAAACARLGLACHLAVLRGRVAAAGSGYEDGGNLLLDRLYGATIHDLSWSGDRHTAIAALVARLVADGRRPVLLPYGISDDLGALGYVLAAQEIVDACPAVRWIVHASGSAGTQAGLLAGLLALGHRARVIGIDVDAEPDRIRAEVCRLGRAVAARLGMGARWDDRSVEVAGGFSAGAYGQSDASTAEAILLGARLEGLVLDPVYTGKSLAGLIGLARRGCFEADDAVVWIHTGGAPALFAYPDTMAAIAAGPPAC